MNPMMLNPGILLLREGTDTSQGKAQIVSNINACQSVVDIVKTTLGPRGMDKMIQHNRGTTISNDGATIMSLLDIVHPAAKLLVDIAQSQDNEVGDGTTSVTLIAGELLKEAKAFVEDGMKPQLIIQGFTLALKLSQDKLQELASEITEENRREVLLKCAQTSLNSKLLNSYKEHFSELVVQAVERLDQNLLDKDLIGVKMVTGGSISDSFLIDGVAFKKTFSYAGFEQQKKQFDNPLICLLNMELELKSEKENAEIRLEKPEEYQAIVDAEWKIIYDKLDKIIQSGASIVLSKLPIGDLATQYFADRGLFCAGRVANDDLTRVQKAVGGQIQTTVNGLTQEMLGKCGQFEEQQVGAERYNLFTGCPQSQTSTIVLRGGAEQFIAEAERSLNDAIMIVRRAVKAKKIVPGGGAIELELSKYLRNYARQISGKNQLIINVFAKALEVIPRNIADNAGFDSVDVLNRLRQKHAQDSQEGHQYGVDINDPNGIGNTFTNYVWEPVIVKRNVLGAATEAASTILSIDETVKNPQSEQDARMKGGAGRGRGGRNPMSLQGLARNMKLGK